ncbi:hypothetical protein U9M48_015385 [Paspalum notatum var. saurae]|uniref:Uncharacterized protein n=1 Tax=Paspalum notatum var. saurae TaxID=547442 RepID=A0AAQ3WLY9_PASNO
MVARVSGSPARWRTMKVMRTDDVSWPATRTTMALSTISSSVSSCFCPSSARRLARQLTRSSPGDASPRSSRAFFSPSVASSALRAVALARRLLRNAVNGRSSGTDHIPSSMSANAAARRSLTAPRSRPNSSVATMSNRQHRDGAPPGPPAVEVPRDLRVHRAHVPPQRVGLQELHQGAAHAPVVVADELQDVALPQDERQAPGLLRRQRLAREHQLVRRRPRHEHRRRAEQRQLRHWAIAADPFPQPLLAGVALHGAEQGQAVPDHRQAQ